MAAALGGCEPGNGRSHVGGATVTHAVTVEVTDAAGRPAGDLTVFATRLDSPVITAGTTDPLGIARFVLEEGNWCMATRRVSGAAAAEVAGSTGRVGGRPPGAPDSVRFTLRLAPESIALGRTTAPGLADLSGTIIGVAELPTLATTAADGSWQLGGLPPGVWTGYASHLGYRTAGFDIAVPAPGETIQVADVVLSPGTPARDVHPADR